MSLAQMKGDAYLMRHKVFVYEFGGGADAFDTALQEAAVRCEPAVYDRREDAPQSRRYCLSVAPAGRAAGYWYLPRAVEQDGRLMLTGEIRLLGSSETERRAARILASGEVHALSIFFFPYLLPLWCWRRLRRRPELRALEDKLDELMILRLHCRRLEE